MTLHFHTQMTECNRNPEQKQCFKGEFELSFACVQFQETTSYYLTKNVWEPVEELHWNSEQFPSGNCAVRSQLRVRLDSHVV